MEPNSAVIILLTFATLAAIAFWIGRTILMRRARAHDYESVRVYLQAVPGTDEQKLDAVDLTLKGGVMIILGILFPPLIFVGLVPLYYGFRKITMTLMGLGLTDDPIS